MWWKSEPIECEFVPGRAAQGPLPILLFRRGRDQGVPILNASSIQDNSHCKSVFSWRHRSLHLNYLCVA